MKLAELDARLREMFDSALLYHGFVSYMRDYEMLIYQTADTRSGIPPRYLKFLFRICPEVQVQSRIRPEVWSRSVDDRLIEKSHVFKDSPGYVWGVRCQELYPGAKIVDNSPRAQRWTKETGIQFHEVDIEANAHRINLIFSSLSTEEIGLGYAPFEVGLTLAAETYEDGSKIPLNPFQHRQDGK